MCLTIDEIPVNLKSNEIVVQKVYKLLHREGNDYTTPYTDTLIPNNGLLMASNLVGSLRYDGIERSINKVYEGNIHSYCDIVCSTFTTYTALAIDVTAWGEYEDLVSSIIYIPRTVYTKTNKFLNDLLHELDFNKPMVVNVNVIAKHLPKRMSNYLLYNRMGIVFE